LRKKGGNYTGKKICSYSRIPSISFVDNTKPLQPASHRNNLLDTHQPVWSRLFKSAPTILRPEQLVSFSLLFYLSLFSKEAGTLDDRVELPDQALHWRGSSAIGTESVQALTSSRPTKANGTSCKMWVWIWNSNSRYHFGSIVIM